jgi:hypothetical protein
MIQCKYDFGIKNSGKTSKNAIFEVNIMNLQDIKPIVKSNPVVWCCYAI